jgi:hypothetical protein
MIVKDKYGNVKDWNWLVEQFGEIVVRPASAGPGWRVAEIRENDDLPADVEWVDRPPWAERELHTDGGQILAPAAILVHVQGAQGAPVPELGVAWYWPDADVDPDCGPVGGVPAGMIPQRCDLPVGKTNGNGDIGLAMGRGAYYSPPGIGPHAAWIYGAMTNSDVVFGLGMIAGTNHRHLDLTYQWSDEGPGECPWEAIHQHLDAILDRVQQIRDLQVRR